MCFFFFISELNISPCSDKYLCCLLIMCRFLSLWFCPLLVSNELQYECDFQVYRKKFHLQTDHFSPLAIELMSCGLSHINVCPWVLVHLPESWITCLCKQMFPTLATKFAWGQGTFICSSKKTSLCGRVKTTELHGEFFLSESLSLCLHPPRIDRSPTFHPDCE